MLNKILEAYIMILMLNFYEVNNSSFDDRKEEVFGSGKYENQSKVCHFAGPKLCTQPTNIGKRKEFGGISPQNFFGLPLPPSRGTILSKIIPSRKNC